MAAGRKSDVCSGFNKHHTGENRSVGNQALLVLLSNNVCVCEAKFKGAEAAVQCGGKTCSPLGSSAGVCRV